MALWNEWHHFISYRTLRLHSHVNTLEVGVWSQHLYQKSSSLPQLIAQCQGNGALWVDYAKPFYLNHTQENSSLFPKLTWVRCKKKEKTHGQSLCNVFSRRMWNWEPLYTKQTRFKQEAVRFRFSRQAMLHELGYCRQCFSQFKLKLNHWEHI